MPSIEEKIAELTTEIGRIDVSGVELSARPGVITYKDRLQKEELLLRGSAVKEDNKRAWRHVFDHLQQPQKEGNMAVTLPFTGSPQVRQRWETVKFVWRGCFADCEETLFSDPIAAAPVFGLVGPQGFGKTVLLRYLHAKYAFSDEYLVVHVPFMPVEPDLGGAQQNIKAAFYAACSLRDLPYEDMGHAGSLSDFIGGITLYAENQGLTLLIILDQLRVSDNVKNLMDAILLGMGNFKGRKSPRVIISSSTSHTSSEVFGASVHLHLRFENFTTAGEAEALAQGTAVDASNLRNVSFLEAVRRCQSGKTLSLAEDALQYWEKWLENANDNAKAEHMFVFHAVVSGEEFDADVPLSNKVDGNSFFWLTDSRRLMERRPRLAETLLEKLKEERQTHAQFLNHIVDSPFFPQLPRRTRGNILEDCLAEIMRERKQAVVFRATKLDGGTTIPNTLPMGADRVVFNFRYPSLEGVSLEKGRIVVAVPLDPDYTSVDFIVIHVHDEKKARVWFLQSTVSTPEKHGCLETENFQNWLDAVSSKVTVTHKRLLFITPNKMPLVALATLPGVLKPSEVVHCRVSEINGDHMLLESLKKPGKFE